MDPDIAEKMKQNRLAALERKKRKADDTISSPAKKPKPDISKKLEEMQVRGNFPRVNPSLK